MSQDQMPAIRLCRCADREVTTTDAMRCFLLELRTRSSISPALDGIEAGRRLVEQPKCPVPKQAHVAPLLSSAYRQR